MKKKLPFEVQLEKKCKELGFAQLTLFANTLLGDKDRAAGEKSCRYKTSGRAEYHG